jgi:RNA polymerase sigma-70 factor, ECF subfamily
LQKTEEEFRKLIESRQTMVFSIALRILRDPSVAEEIAQDVFLCLYERLSEIENPAHLDNWLRRVTAHRSIDWLRRVQRSPEVLTEESVLEDLPEPAASGVDPWLKRQADVLIASLPEIPRTILVMRYQQDLMPEEIADLMEMPVATVKSHLQRTLKLLREKAARVSR